MAKINALMTKEDEQNGEAADELLDSISKAVGQVRQDYTDYCAKLEKRPKMQAMESPLTQIGSKN